MPAKSISTEPTTRRAPGDLADGAGDGADHRAGHDAQARPESFADLAEKVSPAVVNITTSTVVAQGTGPLPMVPEGSPFEDFFREFQDRNGDRPRRTSALGSGFVISEDGYVVTNNHVIEKADEIIVEFFRARN